MQSTKIVSFITWFILLFLAVPSFLILSSWNSLPGDSLYAVKRGLEDVLLTLVSPSQSLSSNLSIKYSERRFIEATSLISEKHSIVGLASFEQQVQTTQEKIQNTADPKTQQDLKDQLVSNLQTYNQQLEETKTQVTASSNQNNIVATQTPAVNNPVTYNPTATNTPTATTTPTPTVVIVTSTPTLKTETEAAKSIAIEPSLTTTPTVTTSGAVQQSTSAQIVTAIDQTQVKIGQAIKELKQNDNENKQKEDINSNNNNYNQDNGAGNKKKD